MNIKQAILHINKPKIFGQLRHLMNTIGAVLATHGAVNDLDWQVWSGLALAVVAFAGSLMASEKQ